jgi:hypothetical protein
LLTQLRDDLSLIRERFLFNPSLPGQGEDARATRALERVVCSALPDNPDLQAGAALSIPIMPGSNRLRSD